MSLLEKVYIVIAAYNEDKTLAQVLSDLKKNYQNIIVVDDGSTDNTYQQALAAGVTILSHLINRGQGAALATGINYALKVGAEIIITFDADGQHQVADIPMVIKPIVEQKVDVVLGSRFLNPQSTVPFFRKIILKSAIIFTWIISGVKLTDAHNGFRAFSRLAAEKIKINHDRMAHSSEIIEQIKRNKLSFKEVAVTINYTKYSLAKGQSALDSLKIVKDIFFKKIIK